MGTRIPRTTLTIKLTAGKDADLLDWLNTIPKGRRQAIVKSLLRDAIQQQLGELGTERRAVQIAEDTAWIRAALSDLPAWMTELLSHAAVVQPSEILRDSMPARKGQLSPSGVAQREQRIAKAAW